MKVRFRIGVDARAFSSPAGGVRRYTWEIYSRLARETDVEVVAVGATADSQLPPCVLRHPATAFPTNLGWTALSLPLAARRARLNVFHAPAYTAPLWGVHPQAVTIHDVSYERVPEWNAYKNDRARRWFYRRGALAADRVITDSQFSRREIAAAYAISATAIDVVPLAAAESFTPGAFDESRVPAGVRRPYVLHVGDLQVRRNLETALGALIGVRPGSNRGQTGVRPGSDRGQTGVRPLLVCAGVDRGIGESLRAQARAADDPDALVLTGPVDDATLLNLYRGAEMLVYPSRYEGFGLPIVEAMRCGIPVIAARTSSLPEVVGDAGILVDALDVAAWTDAIAGILNDATAAASLRQKSIARAAEFSWNRTACETLAALRACAGLGR